MEEHSILVDIVVSRTLSMRQLRALFCFLFAGIAALPCAGSDCVTRAKRYRIDRAKYTRLQEFVNEGHQPWRTDASAAAGSAILEEEKAGPGWNAYGVPLKNEKVTERVATYESIDMNDSSRSYRITLKRFDWLLKIAGSWRAMIWIPTSLETTTCKGDKEQR